jgi:hypothetical protein
MYPAIAIQHTEKVIATGFPQNLSLFFFLTWQMVAMVALLISSKMFGVAGSQVSIVSFTCVESERFVFSSLLCGYLNRAFCLDFLCLIFPPRWFFSFHPDRAYSPRTPAENQASGCVHHGIDAHSNPKI